MAGTRRLILSCVSAALVLGVIGRATQAPVPLRIAFAEPSAIAPRIRALAVDEASQIWTRYGIAVQSSLTGDAADAASILVVIDTASGAVAGADNGLAAIRFDADGLPEPKVTMFYAPLRALLSTAMAGTVDLRQAPAALGDLVLARAMGRTLAHEIGHFVLRSTRHSAAGLMGARQHASALADPSRRGFTLANEEAAQLRTLLAATAVSAALRHP